MKEINALLKVIRCALNSEMTESIPYDTEMDKAAFVKLIQGQKLVSLVCPVLEMQTRKEWKEIYDGLKEEYHVSVYRTISQQVEMEAFLQYMEKKEEPCLPLKGWVMREYYPDVMLRNMTDLDILMKYFESEKYLHWMKELGYKVYLYDVSHHDVYIKPPYIDFEIHKRLYSEKENEGDLYQWMDTIWDRCVPTKDSRYHYRMTEEDFYLYHLIHIYRHFTSIGCGIRPLVDMFVFLKQTEQRLDWNYIKEELRKMNLTRFETVMKSLCKKMFSDTGKLTEEERQVLSFMLKVGLYGDKKNVITKRMMQVKSNSFLLKTIGTVFITVFQPYDTMKKIYPVLKKCPVLLPFCWMIRGFDLAFHRNIGDFVKGSKEDSYQELNSVYDILGIDKVKGE